MVRFKLYGILSIFIFSIPKLFSTTAHQENTPSPKIIISDTDIIADQLAKALPVEVKVKPKPTSVQKLVKKPIAVTASVYFPEVAQTDSTPFITADGSRINKKKPGKHRWVAVSRNLLRKWGGSIDYGDTLRVKGISKRLDGVYVVRDTMKRKLRNRIDILVNPHDEVMGIWNNVKVYHLN